MIIEETKYCLYSRKSTEQDERQALSIDSQIKEMLKIAEKENLNIIDIKRESHSAKDSGKRPIYEEMLTGINEGKYNAILTWAPDRLSRNAGDLGSLVDLMDQNKLVEIKTYGQCFTNNPSEKFLLMILCSQAKLENDNKSINVKRGLKTRVEMGLWPAPAPTGYFKEKSFDKKCETFIDKERSPVIQKMFEKVAYERWSGRQVYNWLRYDLDFKTINGKYLTLSNIYLILQNHFYYGTFEYPKKSGNWYQGKHTPLITKELFDQVQSQIKNKTNCDRKTKEFAFTKLLTCGLCGSGVTADEKYKKLKSGEIKSYRYYTCTKVRDRNCKCGYIREEELIKQLKTLIGQINIDEICVKEKIEYEIERFKKFERLISNKKSQKIEISQIDIKNYLKFILEEGSQQEKRELLSCLRDKLILKDKQIYIEEI